MIPGGGHAGEARGQGLAYPSGAVELAIPVGLQTVVAAGVAMGFPSLGIHLLMPRVWIVRRDGPERLLPIESFAVIGLLILLEGSLNVHHASVVEHEAGKEDGPLSARVVAAVGDPEVVVRLRHAVVVNALLHVP